MKKTTASPHLLILTASLLGAIAFAAEGYATSPDANDNAAATATATAKEPLPAEIAAKPAAPATPAKARATNTTPRTATGAAPTTATDSTAVLAGQTVASADDPAIALPAMTVESQATAILSTDTVLTNKGAGAAARDRQFTSDVDRALNSKTLPLVGKTPEERSLAKEQEEMRLAQIAETKAAADALKTTEPTEAAELKKDAYDMSVRENSFNENLPPSVRRDAPR